eukprot:jgi/Ulvmu1/4133/UM019_0112.1
MVSARGCLFVLEGLDRAGKSTQASVLAQYLKTTFKAEVKQMKFPDRGSKIGKMIDNYLADGVALDDHAIHLLFSANRWECRNDMEALLLKGTHIVLDRYAYSGVAYSAAKHLPGMDRAWCASSDVGLIAPDAVIFLQMDASNAESRDGYGQERYEKLEMQQRVAEEFKHLQDARFHVIDASRTVDDVSSDVQAVADVVVRACQEDNPPLDKLWESPCPSVVNAMQAIGKQRM